MNRVLRIDEEKPEMHISVQGYKVTLCFAEKENPEVAVLGQHRTIELSPKQKNVQPQKVRRIPQSACEAKLN